MQYCGWPDKCASLSEMWQLVFWLQEWQSLYRRTLNRVHSPSRNDLGPLLNSSADCNLIHNSTNNKIDSPRYSDKTSPMMVIVDLYGGRQTGIFCCLTTLYCQLETDCTADVYQIAKLVWQRRPNIFETVVIKYCLLIPCAS